MNKKKKIKKVLLHYLESSPLGLLQAEFERVEVGYNTVSSSIVEGVMGDPACDMGGQKLFCDLCTIFIIS